MPKNPELELAFNFINKTDRNLFITGKAGTGKSHVLKQAIKEMQDEGFEVAVLGTTGIAAMNVEGATITTDAMGCQKSIMTLSTNNSF